MLTLAVADPEPGHHGRGQGPTDLHPKRAQAQVSFLPWLGRGTQRPLWLPGGDGWEEAW